MRGIARYTVTVVLAAGFLAAGFGHAEADVASDKAAAVVIWPAIGTGDFTQVGLGPVSGDTLIQLSNTSTQPVMAQCFYLNANSHCTNTGEVCINGGDCAGPGGFGLCVPGWNETDFQIRLTARQPIAWVVSEGLLNFCEDDPEKNKGQPCIPINGTSRGGADTGQNNVGTRIPPAPEDPFVGELKCIVVDSRTGEPILLLPNGTTANVLIGEATVVSIDPEFQVAKYNAIGIRALPITEAVDDGNPKRLTLLNNGPDGEVGEYEGCPNTLILNHFFDGAINPVSPAGEIYTAVAFVPCTQDLLNQRGGLAVAQYLVFNEFEQRFSTSNTIDCFRGSSLSLIDTNQYERSIFHVAVAGTLVGQTRVRAIGDGLLAVAFEANEGPNTVSSFNVHYQGRRAEADVITLP